jgi:DNA-binding response OmpR family regulator
MSGLSLNQNPETSFRDPQQVGQSTHLQHVKVIACEDSRLMREYIISGLALFGISVMGVATGRELDQAVLMQEPDIVILDIGLPEEDGYSIAERIRQERPGMGIIMLTSRNQLDDRVKGLDCGADLYFAKPVDMRELASAIGSLQRRLARNRMVARSGSWKLDASKSCLTTPTGAGIELTDNELRFLAPLADHPGEVVTRELLFIALDQKPDVYAMRRMETLLSRLRAKVQKASPEEPLPVRARHGRGYAFLGDVTQENS